MGREQFLRERERDFYNQVRKGRTRAKSSIHGAARTIDRGEKSRHTANGDLDRNALIDRMSEKAI